MQGIAYEIVIPEAAQRLSGTAKKERLLLGGPGSAACFAGLRPG